MDRVETVTRALAFHHWEINGSFGDPEKFIFQNRHAFVKAARTIDAALDTQPSIVSTVVRWCDEIKNDRTKETVLKSIQDETEELREEVEVEKQGLPPVGEDGIYGETVDVIASALDLIRMERPDSSVQEIEKELNDYLEKKCAKWARKVAEGAYG